MTTKPSQNGQAILVVLFTLCSYSAAAFAEDLRKVGDEWEIEPFVRARLFKFPEDPMHLKSGVLYPYCVELTNLHEHRDICLRIRLKVRPDRGLEVTPSGWQYDWLDGRRLVKDRPERFWWTLKSTLPDDESGRWNTFLESQVLFCGHHWAPSEYPPTGRPEPSYPVPTKAAADEMTCVWDDEQSKGYLRIVDVDGKVEQAEYGVRLKEGAVYEALRPVLVEAKDFVEFEPSPGKKQTVLLKSNISLDQGSLFTIEGLNQCLAVYRGRARMSVEPQGPNAALFKEKVIDSHYFKPRVRRRWLKTDFGTFAPKQTDFLVEVEPTSQAVLSVLSGEVEYTLPTGPSEEPEQKIGPTGIVSAGGQLIIQRQDADIAHYDDPQHWRVTQRKTDAAAMEQRWLFGLGETPLATWGNLYWLDADVPYASKAVREWLGPVQTDLTGQKYCAPLRELAHEIGWEPLVGDVLRAAAATGKPAFMVLRDRSQAEHFAFYDAGKKECFNVEFERWIGDEPLGIVSKEFLPDGTLRVVHGDRKNGQVAVSRHEPNFENCNITVGTFAYKDGALQTAKVLDSHAWEYIAKENVGFGEGLAALRKSNGEYSDMDFVTHFRKEFGGTVHVVAEPNGRYSVQLFMGNTCCIVFYLDGGNINKTMYVDPRILNQRRPPKPSRGRVTEPSRETDPSSTIESVLETP